MTDRSDALNATFERLRRLLDPHRDGLSVTADRPDRLELAGTTEFTVTSGRTGRTIRKRNAYFAGIIRRRDHVALNFMPAYAEPDFMDRFSPALRGRMTGKTCFHFRHPEEVTPEVRRLLREGHRLFRRMKLI